MKKNNKFNEILQKLTSIEIFKLFNKNNENDKKILSLVFEILKHKDFNQGEIIFKEGDIGENFYILTEGTVQIRRKTQLGDEIAIANFDDKMNVSFGEAALMGNETRSATVKAISNCKTIYISGKKFINLCEKEPILGYRVFFQLIKQMRFSIEKANNDIATLYEALFKEIGEIN